MEDFGGGGHFVLVLLLEDFGNVADCIECQLRGGCGGSEGCGHENGNDFVWGEPWFKVMFQC